MLVSFPSPVVNCKPFPICCKLCIRVLTSLCAGVTLTVILWEWINDKRCDPPHPAPFHSPSETCWGGGSNEEESVYLSVCLIALHTLHPCPSAGAKLLKTLLKVSQHLQTKGSHTSVADQRRHGYGEAPWTQCKSFWLRDTKPQAETYI